MRIRDRCYFSLIGTGCLIGYASGVWLLPLVVLIATEAVFWIVERDEPEAAPSTPRARVDETVVDRAA